MNDYSRTKHHTNSSIHSKLPLPLTSSDERKMYPCSCLSSKFDICLYLPLLLFRDSMYSIKLCRSVLRGIGLSNISVLSTYECVKPEMDPAVHSLQFYKDVIANLDCRPRSRFIIIQVKILGLYKSQLSQQLSLVLYCINSKSGVQLHSSTLCDLITTFEDKLRTVLHKPQFGSSNTLLCNLQFVQYICSWIDHYSS